MSVHPDMPLFPHFFMPETEKISLKEIKKLPPKVFKRIIQQIKDHIREDETLNRIFDDYGVSIAELDYIPMYFDDIDVSAKTDHGVISFNYKLLCDGDISKVFSYAIHETTHWLQQCASEGPTKGADEGDYLHNEYEQEGFINQVEFIAKNDGKDEAIEYVDDLLEHHEKEGKERDKLEDILLENV
jgi:hypothetical protein